MGKDGIQAAAEFTVLRKVEQLRIAVPVGGPLEELQGVVGRIVVHEDQLEIAAGGKQAFEREFRDARIAVGRHADAQLSAVDAAGRRGRCEKVLQQPAEHAYSAFAPDALITLAHLRRSLWIYAPNCSGVPGAGSSPWLKSVAFTSGMWSTLVTSALSWSMMAR